jgi:arsenate reductase
VDEPALTVYEKPTCTTCRNLATLLQEKGIDFERVNYHVEPLPEEKIRELLSKANLKPADALRRREPLVQELGLDEKSDDEIVQAMVEHPQLLQRPIVEKGDRAVLARPVERVLDLLG